MKTCCASIEMNYNCVKGKYIYVVSCGLIIQSTGEKIYPNCLFTNELSKAENLYNIKLHSNRTFHDQVTYIRLERYEFNKISKPTIVMEEYELDYTERYSKSTGPERNEKWDIVNRAYNEANDKFRKELEEVDQEAIYIIYDNHNIIGIAKTIKIAQDLIGEREGLTIERQTTNDIGVF